MSLLEQDMSAVPDHLFHIRFGGVLCFSFLTFFFLVLCCLSFFDLRLLITLCIFFALRLLITRRIFFDLRLLNTLCMFFYLRLLITHLVSSSFSILLNYNDDVFVINQSKMTTEYPTTTKIFQRYTTIQT